MLGINNKQKTSLQSWSNIVVGRAESKQINKENI